MQSPDRTIALDITPPTPDALAGLIAILAQIVARECSTAPARPEQETNAL